MLATPTFLEDTNIGHKPACTSLNSVGLPKHHCLLDGFLSNKVVLFITNLGVGDRGYSVQPPRSLKHHLHTLMASPDMGPSNVLEQGAGRQSGEGGPLCDAPDIYCVMMSSETVPQHDVCFSFFLG